MVYNLSSDIVITKVPLDEQDYRTAPLVPLLNQVAPISDKRYWSAFSRDIESGLGSSVLGPG